MDSVSVDLLVRLKRRTLTPVASANAAEEFFVRQSPLYEVVGQLGMWGTLINGIQASSLEHQGMRDATWNGPIGEFRSASPYASGLSVCSKPVCWWLIPPRCSSCTRPLQFSTGWQAPCSTTSTYFLQTFLVSCSVSRLHLSQGIKRLTNIVGLFLYVRLAPMSTCPPPRESDGFTALSPVLVVLCCICRHHWWPGLLLLVRHT